MTSVSMPDLLPHIFDFTTKALSALVGVFAAVVLALWKERKTREVEAARERTRLEMEHADVRRTLLSSVVKNATMTKRLKRSVGATSDPYLLQIAFELAVWEAVQAHYVNIAPLDERILFARFFDQVRRASQLIEFYRHVRAEVDVGGRDVDPGPRTLLASMEERLRTVADDTALDATVLINDHGEAVHRRILGTQSQRPAKNQRPPLYPRPDGDQLLIVKVAGASFSVGSRGLRVVCPSS